METSLPMRLIIKIFLSITVNKLLYVTGLINIPSKKIRVYFWILQKTAVNPQALAGIAYRAPTSGATTFWFVVWVFKKKEIPRLSVDKFVL